MSRLAPPLLLVILAGCATQDASPEPTSSVATTVERSTTIAPPSTVVSTTATTTTVAPTTAAPTTTTVPGSSVVAMTCEVLRTAPWSERRGAIMVNTAGYEAAGGTGPLVDPVRAACPDDLARAEATAALDDRIRAAEQQLAAAGDSGLIEAVSCADGSFNVRVKNPSSEPVGVIAGSRRFDSQDVDRPVDHAEVVWSVAPGSSHDLALPDDPEQGCSATAAFFAADAGPIDASLPVAADPTATGDDPAAWLPSLLTADRVASADVRVLRDRDRSPPPPMNDGHPIVSATPCASTMNQLDADHVAFAFRIEFGAAVVDLGDGPVEHPAFSVLLYDAFRRGAGGQWRSLVGGQPLTGTMTAADCGPVVPHP